MTDAATLTRKIDQLPIAAIIADPECQLRAACSSVTVQEYSEALVGPRFEHMVKHLHRLGPRPLAELLADGRRDLGEAYAALDPEILRALGADSFPPMPLEVVR